MHVCLSHRITLATPSRGSPIHATRPSRRRANRGPCALLLSPGCDRLRQRLRHASAPSGRGPTTATAGESERTPAATVERLLIVLRNSRSASGAPSPSGTPAPRAPDGGHRDRAGLGRRSSQRERAEAPPQAAQPDPRPTHRPVNYELTGATAATCSAAAGRTSAAPRTPIRDHVTTTRRLGSARRMRASARPTGRRPAGR